TTKDVWIDFDAAHSIQVVQAGASGQYLLRPTIRAFDRLATGSIHGTLTDAATTQPLAGARVYAEGFDGTGAAFIARSTVTDSMGAYTLDLLPVGATYHVVSQPVVGTVAPVAYAAKASDGFALSAMLPVFTYNAAFTVAASVGGVGGNLTPMATASQSDRVHLLQSLTTASGDRTFIVQSTMATVGASAETYAFPTVPVGTYTVQALRSTLNADGSTSTSLSAAQPAAVTVGVTAAVNLGL
ncbi:MAG TPA: carboxypeptidase regulatory-like domain-containing protein, partial [Geothrix sp.]|nr:carboxypeptidase regulatory-like domain-containing protein [Geothrix sp.]